MGRALTTQSMLGSCGADAFRLRVLNGCRVLDVDQLRGLADELHAYARERRARDPSFHGYAQQRMDECENFHLADRRI